MISLRQGIQSFLLAVFVAVIPARLAAHPRQHQSDEGLREVRIYIIQRTNPERPWNDAVAALTVERRFGRGATFFLPRINQIKSPPAEEVGKGVLRTLQGTPYFIELDLGETSQKHMRGTEAPSETWVDRPGVPKGAQEILQRAHRGVYFARAIPAALLSKPFSATVTIRLGSLTMTSEEFQVPPGAQPSYDEAARRAGQSLDALTKSSHEGRSFMDLRPSVVELIRNLGCLAPAGFEDNSGTVERDRQWCLAVARGIETACYDGNTGRVQNLCAECAPRLKAMQEFIQNMKPRGEPEPMEPPAVK